VNDLDQAVERFLRASSLTTTDQEQAEELLGILIASKRAKLALQVLGQMERSDRVLRSIVNVREMAEEAEKALPELKELLRRHPDDTYVVRRLAELAVVRRDFPAAISYYKTLRDLDPKNETVKKRLAEAILLQGREEIADGRYDAALTHFDESFKLDPPSPGLRREYAGILAKAGRLAEAIKEIEPFEDADSRILLASFLEMQGEYREALRILLKLEKSRALSTRAERGVIRLLMADENYNEAVDRIIAQMEKTPDDPWLQHKLIEAVAASTREDQVARQAVVELFQRYRADGFREFDAGQFERLGDALRKLGLFDEARIALAAAVAEFPDQRRLRLRLAQTLGELGRYDDAEVQYKTLLDTRPSLR
jgi:predicted Zn-dependent protease